jgi:hypothetical protein
LELLLAPPLAVIPTEEVAFWLGIGDDCGMTLTPMFLSKDARLSPSRLVSDSRAEPEVVDGRSKEAGGEPKPLLLVLLSLLVLLLVAPMIPVLDGAPLLALLAFIVMVAAARARRSWN